MTKVSAVLSSGYKGEENRLKEIVCLFLLKICQKIMTENKESCFQILRLE
jgi:hypothetical protein